MNGFRLAGNLVSDAELAAALEECERANAGEPITVFEITTAVGLLLFSRHPSDVLLMEVGLGGRLDATNVIDKPLATIITPISIDHTDFLGDTLGKNRRRESRHFQTGRYGDRCRASQRSAGRARTAGGAAESANENCRRRLDCDRGTRPAGLSGQHGVCSIYRRRNFTAAISSRTQDWRLQRCARYPQFRISPAAI